MKVATLQDTILNFILIFPLLAVEDQRIYILADNRLHKNEVCPYLAKGLDLDHKKCNLTDMNKIHAKTGTKRNSTDSKIIAEYSS